MNWFCCWSWLGSKS